MCGIVACILKDNRAAPVLLECVRRLEYRGYDSVGIATADPMINIKKDRGKIDEVDSELDLADLPGSMGIAHVRWATHGLPTAENAHPHTDCTGEIAVVHNGIIENYLEVKEELESEGHVFRSETDTEVIPHLIEKYMDEGMDLEAATATALRKLKGAYAIAAISSREPGRVVGARKESPLIVGVGDGEFFLASDVPAILNHTKNIIYLDDGEMVIIDGDVRIRDLDGNTVSKEVHVIDWTADMAEKAGYDHFMIKEIHEEPGAVRDTLTEMDDVMRVVKEIGEVERVCFVACGTSYHASLVGKYLFESILGIPTDVILASEFRYSARALTDRTLAVFISQSGETADTLNALRSANSRAKTLAIVNVLGSSATREAQHVLYTRAGPEIGVAATKTYVSQLTIIYMLVAAMGAPELIEKLEKVPAIMEEALGDEDNIRALSSHYSNVSDFFFIGRGFSYPTALEGALKLKEITYIHGEGYAAGELKHGPLALIDDGVPVVAISPPGPCHDKTLSNVEEVRARGARVIGVGSTLDEALRKEADDFIGLSPEVDEVLSPLVYIVPLQLLSYYVSVERGLDPDKPKNLAKCVTVE
ncbi:glutamine--fructose-6-phosphate transaminase (isomerizing) [Methanothermobacter marburgensis]|uniref:Glutamine--fructose-6-phosphate aminotransferase [isomerizing] n=1 Tax=Methanothermobacter marburgensis (strain ATCC BAA-927 / DSM 2133 / JCM 14651 / NBRC 100331 / OCM 82 / Marburg) TaxID=79929 RepID=D9PVG9_METTM|nr:glutamine--fructose-6-phosphate transaminase (isomerizing) [Methanothermobacter marburgensis]ADL58217.1 glucosamine-fructose-6-phosphate aminotransferase [Methanothermobacter marburgensis str. Marburg]WBF10385.1 glutamine--fructose-6-phosphate transaminase (isomerizing) [Methanothermobacter marburgensis]